MTRTPFFSIIVPVYNGGDQLPCCLNSVQRSTFTDWELIVIDDGSGDGSRLVAERFGAIVLGTASRQGPAAARNLGARRARGNYLFFTDADCEFHVDTLARTAQRLQAAPKLEALFGSYDDRPAAANFMAQYKNLFHHYIHQNSGEDASTFWAGCGVVKRSVFLNLGGYDVQRYRRPSIEDIDLGYRLKQAGGHIRLAKDIQVKHLKAWTFFSVLRSDILDRGIPWTRLMLRHQVFMSDLNLQTHNRISVVALFGLLLSIVIGFFQPIALLVTFGLFLLLLWLNSRLYHFFYQKRGLLFVAKVVPVHWFYYAYNAVSFAGGLLLHWRDQFTAKPVPSPKPWVDGGS